MELGFAHLPCDSIEDSINLIKYGESNGFDTAWLPDQEFYQDPFSILSAAAMETASIGLGLGVTNTYTRHPTTTARLAGSIQNLCDGRFVLGFGSGNLSKVVKPLGFSGTGIPRRCREAIEINRRLLSGDSVTYQGEYFSLEEITLDFAVTSDVPIYLAANGPVMLRLAGEYADGVFLTTVSEEGLEYATKFLREGLQRSGRELQDIKIICWSPCMIGERYVGDIEQFYRLKASQIDSTPTKMLRELGFDQEWIRTAKNLHSGKEMDELRGFLLEHDYFDHFIIQGNRNHCIDHITRLSDWGVDQLSVLFFQTSVHELEENVKTLSKSILPSIE